MTSPRWVTLKLSKQNGLTRYLRSGVNPLLTYRLRFDEVPGWFGRQDYWLFEFFLETQSRDAPGDLLEMGCYMGRSAILLGLHQREGEQVTVCDLFGEPVEDDANIAENAGYCDVTRPAFEHNYRQWVGKLPTIIQASTTDLSDVLPSGGHRFIHVDASHLYEQVSRDLVTARSLLRPAGIVACDDFRSAHTPGTAAAVWRAVLDGELEPICVSQQKFYATKDEHGHEWRKQLLTAAATTTTIGVETQVVAGKELLRVFSPPETMIGARRNRVERLMLPPWLKERIDQRRLARWMLRWAREQPLVAAEVRSITGIDLLAPRSEVMRPAIFSPRRRGN